MNIVLIGYRGSGKTTVGRLVASRAGRPFVDTDDWIVRQAGRSIVEIFARDGEAAFRDLETAAVLDASTRVDSVIGLGGGALGREENRRAIASAGHQVVYLWCEPEELLRRIRGDATTADSRPHLTPMGGGIDEIRSVLARREPIWREAMHHQLNVTRLTPEEAATAVLALAAPAEST